MKKIKVFLEITSIYTMDNSDLAVSNVMKNSIGLKMVNILGNAKFSQLKKSELN